jgi:hypothetical protein
MHGKTTIMAYKICMVNISERCYLKGKRKMFKQILRKCVLGM